MARKVMSSKLPIGWHPREGALNRDSKPVVPSCTSKGIIKGWLADKDVKPWRKIGFFLGPCRRA